MTYVVLFTGAALVAVGLFALLTARGRSSGAAIQVLLGGAVLVAAAATSMRGWLTDGIETLLVVGVAFTGALALARRPEATDASAAGDSR